MTSELSINSPTCSAPALDKDAPRVGLLINQMRARLGPLPHVAATTCSDCCRLPRSSGPCPLHITVDLRHAPDQEQTENEIK